MLISRIFRLSTRETPDTEASPQLATITESAMPMVTARNCSTIRGRIRIRSCLRVNMPPYFPSSRKIGIYYTTFFRQSHAVKRRNSTSSP